jgi:hypothetical protein
MSLEQTWEWLPNSIEFGPKRFVHTPVFGKQVHEFADPFWYFDLSLPLKGELERRQITALLGRTRGTAVVNIFDPRVEVPHRFETVKKSPIIAQMIPTLTVTATDKSAGTIDVTGVTGDFITEDDPIAFTHLGVRHYYRALNDLTLDGTSQTLLVDLAPRVDLSAQSITAERYRPTQRFQIEINQLGNRTNADGFTPFNLTGVEYFGAIV